MSLIPVILPTTVSAPAFASILTSQDTYLNSLTPLSVIGSGGGGSSNYPANANFSTLNVSSMITSLSLNVSSINGAVPGGGGTVPPDLTLSTLNVSTIINTGLLTESFSTVTSLATGTSEYFCPNTYSIYPSSFVIHPPGNATYFSVDNTQIYVKGVDFYLYQNGLSAYNPRIVFNSGSGTATIEANTPGSANGFVIQSSITTSAFSVSSINNIPALTLAQYQYLSSITPP